MNAPVEHSRKVRNSALMLGVFAFAVYLGFIAWSVLKQG